MEIRDSLGNKLPKSRGNDLTMSTFLLAVTVAMDKGHFVEYRAGDKTAAITEISGTTTYAVHN